MYLVYWYVVASVFIYLLTNFYVYTFQVCDNGHKPSFFERWRSQPLVNGMRLGDLTVAAGTLFSGNNFRKIHFFFKCINAGCISESTFLRIQRLYAVPSVTKMYGAMQRSALDKFHGHSVILMGTFAILHIIIELDNAHIN